MNLTIESGIELNDGRFIPRLAFGTFNLADGDEATAAVTCAIEAGYRHIDCARFYGNEKGVGAAAAWTTPSSRASIPPTLRHT